jgi:hypothetical protein
MVVAVSNARRVSVLLSYQCGDRYLVFSGSHGEDVRLMPGSVVGGIRPTVFLIARAEVVSRE